MRVAIIGLGLIGGSWALALREWAKTEEGQAAGLELVGFDAKGRVRTQADKMGLCHRYTATPMEAVKGAQIVIVATPVMAVRDTFEDIADELAPGAVVTDVCSTKRQVISWADELLPTTVSFVGGHPMAGKTASLEEAEASLFKDCTYCLISSTKAREDAVDTVVRLVEAVGAKPYFIDAGEHDSYVAAVSHLPFLLAAGLVNVAGDSDGWREINRLASTGFGDTTRLASGSTAMHLDICRTNSDAILGWIDRYQEQLNRLRDLVNEAGLYDERGRPRPDTVGDSAPLEEYFDRAAQTRARWLSSRSGPTPEEQSVIVPMPSKKETQSEYSRMLFGGLFTNRRKRPDDNETPGKR